MAKSGKHKKHQPRKKKEKVSAAARGELRPIGVDTDDRPPRMGRKAYERALAELLGAADSVTRHYVGPHALELALVRQKVASMDLEGVKAVHVIGPAYEDALADLHFDEFSLPSTIPSWSRGNMIWIVLAERLGHAPPFPIKLASPKPQPYPDDERVVDMRDLGRYR